MNPFFFLLLLKFPSFFISQHILFWFVYFLISLFILVGVCWTSSMCRSIFFNKFGRFFKLVLIFFSTPFSMTFTSGPSITCMLVSYISLTHLFFFILFILFFRLHDLYQSFFKCTHYFFCQFKSLCWVFHFNYYTLQLWNCHLVFILFSISWFIFFIHCNIVIYIPLLL